MSSNSLPVSPRRSSSSTYTTDTLVREMDSMRETLALPAMPSSTRLVTSCSIRSAFAPGHGVKATACRTWTSGSFRWGMLKKA